jgi:predicted ABC-type ATPase
LREPFLLMVAGPNGSGKTTLTRLLLRQGIDFGEYINPDDIALELSGAPEARVAQAQMIADRRRDACIRDGRSFSFEIVMSHASKIDVLIRAKTAGFYVRLFFVGIDDARTNIDRVAIRVAGGGHDVPEAKIVSRWARSMALLIRAIRSSDEAFVFDNSVSGGTDLTVPRLACHVCKEPASTTQYPPTPPWVREYVLRPLNIS